MTIQELIKKDIIKSMKAKTPEVTSVLRVVSGEFGRVLRDGVTVKEVTDDEAIKVIRKMTENAKEQGNTGEAVILEMYLPQMLSEDHIRVIVEGTIKARGFSGMKDMGKAMGSLKAHPNFSQIDGKISSKIVKELLS